MSHRTLIDGTGYDITGGRTLIDGTGYDIKGGRTLVDGVGYDISFGVACDPVLNNNTWEQIRAASDAGIASSLWSIGDCKEIVLNGALCTGLTLSNYSVCVFVIGIDHNATLEGSNRIHFQLGKTALSGGRDIALCDSKYGSNTAGAGYFVMNGSNKNSGGWESCYMRLTICETMKRVISVELSSVLKSVTKYTNNTGNSTAASAITATTDYFFLPSDYEVYGSCTYSNTNEASYQAQYAYYAVGNSKIKYKHSATNVACQWYLRSPYASGSTAFVVSGTTGAVGISVARYSYGFAPCFCV